MPEKKPVGSMLEGLSESGEVRLCWLAVDDVRGGI